jgi:hypothetical protein
MSNIFKTIAEEIYKPALKRYPTRKAIARYPNNIWSIDLADNNELAEYNDGYRYMINCVDVFSRYAWSVPSKSKSGEAVLNAFKEIVKENKGIYPNMLWADQGAEFENKEMKKWTKEHNIILYHTYGKSKSAIVERFNRTLKTSLWRYFTEAKTKNWVKVLPIFMRNYNMRKHRTINMTPMKAHNLDDANIFKLYEYQYGDVKPNLKPNKFKVGDYVRISRMKEIFEKGYYPSWSMEIFKVVKVLNTVPWTYHIKDLLGEEIEGSFYEQELQKTKQDPKKSEFLIEEVLDTRTHKGKKQELVKYLGYSNAHNAWIDKTK